VARSQYIYIWTHPVGWIAGAFTVKSEALAQGTIRNLPDDADLRRHYDGDVLGDGWCREPVLVATKRGVVVEEMKREERHRDV